MQRGDLRDNGAEINGLLWGYCQKARIRMSRSRPYKKNDNAWVEQRNWTHVRKVVGYRRLDSDVELAILQELYGSFTIYKNFFQPTMKLAEAGREGACWWKNPAQVG